MGGMCVGYTMTNPTVAFVDACALTGQHDGARESGQLEPRRTTPHAALPVHLLRHGRDPVLAPEPGDDRLRRLRRLPAADGYPDCTTGGNPSTGYPAAVVFGDTDLDTGPTGSATRRSARRPNQQFVATWEPARPTRRIPRSTADVLDRPDARRPTRWTSCTRRRPVADGGVTRLDRWRAAGSGDGGARECQSPHQRCRARPPPLPCSARVDEHLAVVDTPFVVRFAVTTYTGAWPRACGWRRRSA